MIKFISFLFCVFLFIFSLMAILILVEYFKYLKRKFVLFLRSKLKK